ncbi:hypothetical protein E0J21_06535, partial [Rhizobium laguerreae]
GCSHRATWRIQNRRGSSRRWMKVQWQVIKFGNKSRFCRSSSYQYPVRRSTDASRTKAQTQIFPRVHASARKTFCDSRLSPLVMR